MNILQQINASSMIGKKDYSGALSSGIQGIMSILPFGTSTAKTGGEAAMLSVQNVASGAATGFLIGGVPGAAIGAGVGLIGKKGSYNSPQSFTQYGDYTLGTGLFGAFGNSSIRRKVRNMKTSIDRNIVGLNTTQDLLSEWDGEESDLNTYRTGGIVNELSSYLDDGELFKTPDQRVYQVPEQGLPTDQNRMNLPNGTKVLSDSLKFPGTKKTFAEIGKSLMSNKKINVTDKYSENSKKLMDMNNSAIHDDLFNIQELLKNANNTNKGMKNKYVTGGQIMQGVGAAADVMALLAPVFSGLTAKSKDVSPIYNPYDSQVLRLLKNRKYNINPAIQQLQTNRDINNYMSQLINPNTGAGMLSRQLSYLGMNRQIGDLYAQQLNVNNQYAADYANALQQVGAQRAQVDSLTRDINMRSKAAAQGLNQNALTQLSNFALNQKLMSNQKNRDLQMLQLYQKMAESAYGKDFASSFISSITGTPIQTQYRTGILGVQPSFGQLPMPNLSGLTSLNRKPSGFKLPRIGG